MASDAAALAWFNAEVPPFVSSFDVTSEAGVKNRQDNEALAQELRERLERAVFEGPPAAIERHHKKGKLTCRERVALLLDPDSPLLELGALMGWGQEGMPVGGGIFVGIGLICGAPTMVLSHVPTIKAGALNKVAVQKSLRAMEISMSCKLPLVQLVESAGAYLAQQAEVFHAAGSLFRELSVRSRKGLTTVAVVFGSSTAGGAYQPGMSDYTIFVKKGAQVYLGGPPLVEMATGEKVSHEELGGADMHTKVSGVGDFLAVDEHDALRMARRVLAGVNGARAAAPRSLRGSSRLQGGAYEPLFPAEELLAVAPADAKAPYDAREVICRLVDASRFTEFKPRWGSRLVCCHARISGVPVGIIGNNGVLLPEEAQKGTQFIHLCNLAGVPLIYLSNITGFMVGSDYERAGIIKQGALMINAVANSEVPAITIILGSSYGAGNYAMSGRAYKPRFLFSWPQSRCAVMGAAQLAGVMALVETGGNRGDAATVAARREKLEAQIESEATPYYVSSRGIDDGVIDPRDTRAVITFCLSLLGDDDVGTGFVHGVSRL